MGETLKNKTVLVTGGSGFIGSHLVDELLKEEIKKIIVITEKPLDEAHNLKNALKDPRTYLVQQDLTDQRTLKHVLKHFKPETVFNLAVLPLPLSLTHPQETIEGIIKMTTNICELQRKKCFKELIQYSSSEAYGTSKTFYMDETHNKRPITPYAAAKASTDYIALSYHQTFGLPVKIVRPFNNYGPRQNVGQHAAVIPTMIRKMLNDEDIIMQGDGSQSRDFVYVTDTAKATIAIAKEKACLGEEINIATEISTSIKEIIEKLAKLTNYTKEIKTSGTRKGDVNRHCGDSSKAVEILGWEPKVNIDTGLKNTVEWYKQNTK